MKKIITLLLFLMCLCSLASCGNKNTASLQEIKGEELIKETVSSDGRYLIKAYRNNGGSTVDWAVLCTLTDSKTEKTKNIYWQYHEENAIIEWLDNDTVKINEITLELPGDTYDWRNE